MFDSTCGTTKEAGIRSDKQEPGLEHQDDQQRSVAEPRAQSQAVDDAAEHHRVERLALDRLAFHNR